MEIFMNFSKIWAILVFCVVSVAKCDEPRVTLPNGNVLIGLEQDSFYEGKKFHEFRGIPYATPPKGGLRFKAPQKYDVKWDTPRNAVEYGAVCPQDDLLNEPQEDGHVEEIVQPIGDEDCLFINVATPAKKPSSKGGYPVAVWIHGGSFQYESGDAYSPKKFMDYGNVVLVTFNYRLGALGFLNTGDGKIQGNMGLKDQVLALKWVQTNIAAFSGDVNAVTLFGTNSGAVSAHLHMISPMSEGLFHRVLLQSGTAISPWVLQHNPAKTAKTYAAWLNCSGDVINNEDNETTPQESTIDCLMRTDVQTFVRKQARLTEWFIDPMVPMGPSIENAEGSSENEPKFLSEDPYELLQSGNFWAKDKVRLIAGVNSHEGLLHTWDIAHHRMLSRVLTMEWQRALPITLTFRDTALNFKNVSDSVFQFYLEEKEGDQEEASTSNSAPSKKGQDVKNMKNMKMLGHEFYRFDSLTAMYSDRYFFIPVHKTGQLHAKYGSKVYLYWFDYLGAQSATQFSGYNDTVVGAAHYDQVQYMFNTPFFKEVESEEDIKFGRKFMDGIVRFIGTGEPPAGGWVPVNKEMLEGSVPFIYNRIGHKTKAEQMVETFRKSVDFWDTLPLIEYGKKMDQFPEFLERDELKEYEEKDGGDEILPGVTKDDIERLKAKLEL